jgi:polysaccharide biosynthesis transport protein
MLRSLIDEHAKGERGEPSRRPAVHGSRRLWAVRPPPVDQDRHFLDVVRVLYRRRWMILTVAIIGAMLAAAVGLLIAPKYTAIAKIAVEPPQGSFDGRGPSLGEEIIIDTHIATLDSRGQMERVLDSLSSGTDAKTVSPTSVGSDADPTSNQGRGLSLAELARRLKTWSRIGVQRDKGLNLDQLERGSKITQAGRSRIIRVAFTSKNPQQAAALANRIVQLYVDAQYEQKRTSMNRELARLGKRVAELKNEAEGTRSEAQVLVELQRRQDELRSQIEFISADVGVASLANTPERPSSSNPLLFILPASLICAIGASLFAVIVDRLDRRFRSERDVGDALGIPCIGLVPKIASRRRVRPHRYLLAEPFSAYSEAIKSAAATLKIVANNEESKVVLISSSVPMEGRSTLALSLAAYVAVLGRRVVLVDLDFRRASLLGKLSGRTDREIRDLHSQNRPPGEIIQPIPGLGLDYLPMPRRQADPLALVANEQMSSLLQELRDSYDCVIIDGPPVLGATEARLLPALADRVLFVVKWGDTRRDVAQNALRLLRDAGCLDKEWDELPVAIITQVNLKQHARYGFGDTGELRMRYRKYYARSMKAWRSAGPAARSTSNSGRRSVSPDAPAASPVE